MTRRRRKLKTRPPRYLLGRWQMREEGAVLKGKWRALYPLLLAWRQPPPHCPRRGHLQGQLSAQRAAGLGLASAAQGGPGNGSDAGPLSFWVPWAQGPGAGRGTAASLRAQDGNF